jgi:hypothetical protein
MIELKKQLKTQLDLSPEKKTVHQIFFQLFYKPTSKFFRPQINWSNEAESIEIWTILG